MERKWIEYDPVAPSREDGPPCIQRSWFADAGNARNPRPHVRLTAPVFENTTSCRFWMPYEEGDDEPALPECVLAKAL